MANMIDYYAELNLKPTMNASSIMKELVNQERMWAKRESVMPEKAQKKMVIINEAKRIFASESSKAKYDRDLEASKRPPEEKVVPDHNSVRKDELNKWYKDAVGFYQSKQYDLAKTSVEKAMSFLNAQDNNSDFYEFAARVYDANGRYDQAMDFVNKAIIEAPNSVDNYITKALIYASQGRAALNDKYNAGKANGFFLKERETLNIAMSYAERNSNYSIAKSDRGRIYGLLAYSYMNELPKDRNKAKEFAMKGMELGDNWGNSSNVIKAVEKEIEAERKAEEARLSEQRRQEAHQRHLANEREKARLEKEEQDRQRMLQKEKKEQRFRRHSRYYVLSWLAQLLFWVIVGYNLIQGNYSAMNPFITAGVFGLLQALIGYNETARYGYWEDFSPKICFVMIIVFCIVVGSLKFYNDGGGQSIVGQTWKFAGTVTVINVLIFIISRSIGKSKAK